MTKIKINLKALLSASVRAFAVLIAVEFLAEYLARSLFGFNPKAYLGRDTFDLAFSITYFSVLYLGLVLMLVAYVVVRPCFSSRLAAGVVTGGVFFLYTALMMVQLFNFGMMPLELLRFSAVVNSVELPASFAAGILALGPAHREEVVV